MLYCYTSVRFYPQRIFISPKVSPTASSQTPTPNPSNPSASRATRPRSAWQLAWRSHCDRTPNRTIRSQANVGWRWFYCLFFPLSAQLIWNVPALWPRRDHAFWVVLLWVLKSCCALNTHHSLRHKHGKKQVQYFQFHRPLWSKFKSWRIFPFWRWDFSHTKTDALHLFLVSPSPQRADIHINLLKTPGYMK